MTKTDKQREKVLSQIRKLPAPYNAMGERVHELILQAAPDLEPTWRWGLAFYMKDGKDMCYIKKEQSCMTFGFSSLAELSPDTQTPNLIPCAWNFTKLDGETEDRIATMVRRGVRAKDES